MSYLRVYVRQGVCPPTELRNSPGKILLEFAIVVGGYTTFYPTTLKLPPSP